MNKMTLSNGKYLLKMFTIQTEEWEYQEWREMRD
jgi:hypothetical protein